MPRHVIDVLVPLILLALALFVRIEDPSLLSEARALVFDAYQRLDPRPHDIDLPVRIVDIDEDSLARLGQWPWPRSLVARLTQRLGELGAAAIAFDVLFAEPDRTAPLAVVKEWSEATDIGDLVSRLRDLPDPDRMLAATFAKSPVVTAFVTGGAAGRAAPLVKAGFSTAGDDPVQFVPQAVGPVTCLPALQEAAAGNGSADVRQDIDGVVRSVPLIVRIGDTLYPSLAAEALRVAQGASGYLIKSSGASGERSFGAATGISQVRIGQVIVPTTATGEILLYDSGPQAKRFLSSWKILDPGFDGSQVKGAIVLVGSTAKALLDFRSTPLDPAMAGVEIHAQVLEQMMSGQHLYRPDWAEGGELVYMSVLGILMILVTRRAGALASAILGCAGVAAAIGFSLIAFARAGWLIDALYPAVAALIVYIVASALGFLRSERERRHIRDAFGRYLSPILVDELARHPERLKLGGENRDVTLMFCDIRNFTGLAEHLGPQDLTRFINEFLTPMTAVIQARAGTIDKYIGDCIMAFWNAPIPDRNHELNACASALHMRGELARLNTFWTANGETEGRFAQPVAIGIGINTGECCVGNLGSDQRLEYSVMGDAVNLASRLESLTKSYGVDIVLGPETAAKAANFATLEIDLVRVKGKTRPVSVHALIGDEDHARSEGFQVLRLTHAQVLEAFRGQHWGAALSAIAAARPLSPELGPLYSLYEERIEFYRSNPPPADWDGVHTALSKTG